MNYLAWVDQGSEGELNYLGSHYEYVKVDTYVCFWHMVNNKQFNECASSEFSLILIVQKDGCCFDQMKMKKMRRDCI